MHRACSAKRPPPKCTANRPNPVRDRPDDRDGPTCDRQAAVKRNLVFTPPFYPVWAGRNGRLHMKPIDTDATHILAADHRTVEKLFAEFDKASGSKAKGKLADEICTELKIHAQIEED